MSDYILKLIQRGENQQLDFKFEISDSKKIARSLVAFANTDGGKLLVGVKDNGAIAGVRSDEEYHMVEAAAQLYCKPEVKFTTREWNIGGKKVLEVNVPRSLEVKHQAPDRNNEFKIFVRVNDQNLLASSIQIRLWKRQQSKIPVRVSLTDIELGLLHYLEKNESISLAAFIKMSGINKHKAEAILVSFILLGIIGMIVSEKGTIFVLKEPDYQWLIDENAMRNVIR